MPRPPLEKMALPRIALLVLPSRMRTPAVTHRFWAKAMRLPAQPDGSADRGCCRRRLRTPRHGTIAQAADPVACCPDQVALNHIPGGVGQQDAAGVIGGDQVAGPGTAPADRIGGRGVEINSFVRIAQGQRAGDIRADGVALDQVSGGAAGEQLDARLPRIAIGGDQVARAEGGAADGVARRAGNAHSRPAVSQPGGPAGDGANQVALHDVVRRTGPIQKDAVLAVAGNQVASAAGDRRRWCFPAIGCGSRKAGWPKRTAP